MIGKIKRGSIFIWDIFLFKIIYKLSFRLNMPSLSAHLICLSTKILNKRNDVIVLCLGRSQFENDVRALCEFGNKIQYLYIHKIFFGEIVRYFVPFDLNLDLIPTFREKKEKELINYKNITEDGFTYHIDPKYEEGKKRAYNYINKMFPILKKKLKFDSVLSGNHIYIDQQEFFKICEENNTPCLILNKEGISWGHNSSKEDKSNSGLRFVGSKILYLNKNYKNYELKTLNGLNKEKTAIVGLPRFDYYLKKSININSQIVLFSFMIEDYLAKEVIDRAKDKFHSISELFQINVIKFVDKHPEYNLVIKTRDANKNLDYIQELYNNNFGSRIPKNITITNFSNPEKLIINSKAIFGFNSTVLIEALIAKKIIITPDFRELFNDKHTPGIFHDFEDLINQVNSYNIMEDIILNNNFKTASDVKRKNEFLEPLIYKNDGKSSNRVEKEIINSIVNRKNHN